MSNGVRKPVFVFSDLVRHKLGCAATEDGLKLEILGSAKKNNKGAVQLCGYIYAKICFSHDAAHIVSMLFFSDVLNDPVVQNLILDDSGTDETVNIGTQIFFEIKLLSVRLYV